MQQRAQTRDAADVAHGDRTKSMFTAGLRETVGQQRSNRCSTEATSTSTAAQIYRASQPGPPACLHHLKVLHLNRRAAESSTKFLLSAVRSGFISVPERGGPTRRAHTPAFTFNMYRFSRATELHRRVFSKP